MEFRVLGEFEAVTDGRQVDLGHARQRCVLAVLLLDADRTVTADRLIDRVWGSHPPLRARNSLHSYLYRLRRALEPTDVGIVRQPGGFLLELNSATVDLHRFRVLVDQARAAEDESRGLELYDQALRLWRDEPFHGLNTAWLDTVRDTLTAERLAVRLDRNDLALRQGRTGDLVRELFALAVQHPFDERLILQLMLALHLSGRRAEALEQYQRLRLRLAQEFGTDPGAPVQALHRKLLAEDPGPVLAVPAPETPGRPAGVPTATTATVPPVPPPRSRMRLPVLLVLLIAAGLLMTASTFAPTTGTVTGFQAARQPRTGFVRIQPAHTAQVGLCLSEGRDRTGPDDREIAVQRQCAGAVPPRTTLQPLGGDIYRIWWHHPTKGDGCLTVIDIKGETGLRMEPWDDCPDFRMYQQFRIQPVDTPVPGGYRFLPLRTSEQCIGVVEPSTDLGAELTQETCDGQGDQEFLIEAE
ncbi:AfsR/SARP family transcriptional regulator [Amycolatopsis alba]|uniref:AfsR/SARP family transcriptional regulator n=1 Tax=Amycolatopsis alba TaxID=76020 RepID=UPI0003A55063|nr:AfsR/SARP family transcriptional regulator [Amycolatopsis alba]